MYVKFINPQALSSALALLVCFETTARTMGANVELATLIYVRTYVL